MRKKQTPTPIILQVLRGVVTEGFLAECNEAENSLLIWLVASCAHNSMNAELRIVRPTVVSYLGVTSDELAAAVRGLHQKGILNRVDGLYNGWSVRVDLPFLAGQRLVPVIPQSDEKPTPSAATTESDAISTLWDSVAAMVVKGNSVLLVDSGDTMLPLMEEFVQNHPNAFYVASPKSPKEFLKPLVAYLKEQSPSQTNRSSDAADSTALSLRASSETLANAVAKATKGMGITLVAAGIETLTQGTARTLGILSASVTMVVSVRDPEAEQRAPEGFRVVEVPAEEADVTANTKGKKQSDQSLAVESPSQNKKQKGYSQATVSQRHDRNYPRRGRTTSQNDDLRGDTDVDEAQPTNLRPLLTAGVIVWLTATASSLVLERPFDRALVGVGILVVFALFRFLWWLFRRR